MTKARWLPKPWQRFGSNRETRKAIETYNKLSLLNPDKSAYFASLAEQLKVVDMVILFLILIIIISFVLGFIVLVQNLKAVDLPEISRFQQPVHGGKTDHRHIEKGYLAFCSCSWCGLPYFKFFISGSSAVEDKTKNIGNPTQQTAPAPTQNNSPVQQQPQNRFYKRLLRDPVNRQGFLLFCCLHLRRSNVLCINGTDFYSAIDHTKNSI
jgi:hypothetical protein